jgi:proteasome accessory factor B
MPSSKTQRWLDLLALLVGRRVPISIDQIMEGVPAYRSRWAGGDERARASVRRMFERDKDELRRMGIPLETRPFRQEGRAEAEGYLILKRDFYLPYLELLSEGDDPAGAAVLRDLKNEGVDLSLIVTKRL